MPAISWMKSAAELVERFGTALPEHPGVVRTPMFGHSAAFGNGNMAYGLFRDSVVVRIAKGGVASTEGRAQQFTPMPGRTCDRLRVSSDGRSPPHQGTCGVSPKGSGLHTRRAEEGGKGLRRRSC